MSSVVFDEIAAMSDEDLERAAAIAGGAPAHAGRVWVSSTALMSDYALGWLGECAACGGVVDDGPFRFCVGCRQVDLTLII